MGRWEGESADYVLVLQKEQKEEQKEPSVAAYKPFAEQVLRQKSFWLALEFAGHPLLAFYHQILAFHPIS